MKNNLYPLLLAALVGTLVTAPLSGALGWGGNLVEFSFLCCVALAAFGATTAHRRLSLLILAGALSLKVAGILLGSHSTGTAGTLIGVSLAAMAAFRAFRYALGSDEVDTDHICAALSVYMLAGCLYGLLYWRLEMFLPQAFTLDCRAQSVAQFDLPAAIYMSFITLATVGYGDIVPTAPVARGLVITEAVLGQFYMVVLVARLVSVYSQKHSMSRKSGGVNQE